METRGPIGLVLLVSIAGCGEVAPADHESEDRLWHFDGAGWTSLAQLSLGQPTTQRAVDLAVSPSHAVYVLDASSDLTRFDACGVTRWAAQGRWLGVNKLAVVDDEHLVGATKGGEIVRWSSGSSTSLTLPGKFGGLNDTKVTGLVARSFDEQYVGTTAGLFHVVGTQITLQPGHVANLAVDPLPPFALSVVGSFPGSASVLFQLENDAFVPEAMPPATLTIGSGSVRRRGERRLAFAPLADWHVFLERGANGWTSAYTNVTAPWDDDAFLVPSSTGFHIGWGASVYHSDGQTLEALPPLPASSFQLGVLFSDGPSTLFALQRAGAFASFANGVWVPLPPLELPKGSGLQMGYSARGLSNVFASATPEPRIRIPGGGSGFPGSDAMARFDGKAWSPVPPPPQCSVLALAALDNGGAVAATKSCGVQRFQNGAWSPVAGTEGKYLTTIAASATGSWFACGYSSDAFRFSNGTLEDLGASNPGADVHITTLGEEFFASPWMHASGKNILRLNGNKWESVAPMPESASDTWWPALAVTADAFVLTSSSGDLVARKR